MNLISTIGLLLFGLNACSNAYHVPQVHKRIATAVKNLASSSSSSHVLPSRREALQHASSFLLASIALSIPPPAANALESCKSNSHNCIRTTWTAPKSLTSSEVVQTVRDVLNSYPQNGQAGVDCNGWKIVSDKLDTEAGRITLEYKSCVGPAALAINLGQPFIDDLKLELGKDAGGITVEVRSSSRMGSGDLYVNRKRLEYLGKQLKEQGWGIPTPKYAYEM